MERKKLAADAMSTSSARPRSNAELNKERMVELTHQIGLEAKRLAVSRGQLSKLKVAGPAASSAAPPPVKGMASKDPVKKAAAPAGHSHSSNAASTAVMGRPTSSTLPEGLLPELCKYVAIILLPSLSFSSPFNSDSSSSALPSSSSPPPPLLLHFP
jgi:hypothetical protein